MSYLDPADILDENVLDFYNNETAKRDKFLDKTDRKVEAIAQRKGISPSNIPVEEGTGYATTTIIIEFVLSYFSMMVCKSLWGSAHGSKDIYFDKMSVYKSDSKEAIAGMTAANIVRDTPLTPSQTNGSCPNY